MKTNALSIINRGAAALAAIILATLSGCGGGSLEKQVKQALLEGDTTETRFQQICQLICSDSREYADYIDADGNVDASALNEYINAIGSRLRPPRTWNVTAYGIRPLHLSIYLERSGSMTAYDATQGGGELKKVVNDLINFFPVPDGAAANSNVSISIVNDGIYDYNAPVGDFLKDKNIYATTANIGDARYTDFGEILRTILSKQGSDDVAVLVSDMIYSPRDTHNVSTEKIFNEVNSLATDVFKHYPDKAVILSKVRGSYHGTYYPYNGASWRYDGDRPFYVMVIADSRVIDRITTDDSFKRFANLSQAEHTYRFNQPQTGVDVSLLPNWDGCKGRFRVARDGKLRLERCEEDRATGKLRFCMAADLSQLGKTDRFLCDAANYTVTSASGYTIEIAPISAEQRGGNMKSYLEGKTHVITLTGTPQTSRDQVVVSIKNDFPDWIVESSSRDDSRADLPQFNETTFALEPFMRGIYSAYTHGGDNYTAITVEVEK
ncbi:MAG: hypothetical protein ACI4AH_04870 [Muribaculaceae bacterium]